MTTRPQNYVKLLESIDSQRMDNWNSITDEMHVGILATGTAGSIAVPSYVNCVDIIVNSANMYISLEGAIGAIPSSFTKVNYRLLNNQTHNLIYLDSTVTNLYFRNESSGSQEISLVFARTKNQLGDAGTAGRECGNFC